MTKDYAKKRKTNKRRKKKAPSKTLKPNFPVWGWILIGCFIGASFVGIATWQVLPLFYKSKPKTQATKPDAAPIQSIAVNEESEKETAERFDFYTVLPDLKIEVPVNTNIQAKNKPPLNNNAVSLPYIIQVGSFKNNEQANSLKASLALIGFETKIQTITTEGNETWYRVYLGPFTNKESAKFTQNKLAKEHLNSLVLRTRV